MKRVTLDVWQKASILSELKETAVSSIFASKQNAFILSIANAILQCHKLYKKIWILIGILDLLETSRQWPFTKECIWWAIFCLQGEHTSNSQC